MVHVAKRNYVEVRHNTAEGIGDRVLREVDALNGVSQASIRVRKSHVVTQIKYHVTRMLAPLRVSARL